MKVADEALTKSLHFKPNNVNSYINRALARININNLRGAMSDYDAAIDLDPHNFLAHYNRGLMRVQLGDDNRASPISTSSSRWSRRTSWRYSTVRFCMTRRAT